MTASYLQHASELGMDCSDLMLHHCDLGPQNIIVELTTKTIGIIDWEMAGFVPKDCFLGYGSGISRAASN